MNKNSPLGHAGFLTPILQGFVGSAATWGRLHQVNLHMLGRADCTNTTLHCALYKPVWWRATTYPGVGFLLLGLKCESAPIALMLEGNLLMFKYFNNILAVLHSEFCKRAYSVLWIA